MYNLSMTGANVAEEQVLLDNALQHGHYGLIVFCLYPYMLKDHALKAGRVEPRDYWAGLGSLPLLEDYLVSGALRLQVFAPRFTASGSQDMDTSGAQPIGADTALRLLLSQTSGHPTVDVDPLAFDQLRALVSSARSSGSTVAAYFPPVYLPRYEAMRVGYEAFRAQMLTLFAPGEAIIDLNDGTFSGFSAEPRNFLDGSHYSHRGAALVSKAFADRLAGALGALPRSKLGR